VASTSDSNVSTSAELQQILQEIESSPSQLHPIELEIARGLAARPLHTWCSGCHRMIRRLHAKAVATRVQGA
jgi:hypothetical protein